MHYPLAVFTPFVGAGSETFIARHITDLVPGGTVVVANERAEPYNWDMNPEFPSFIISGTRMPLIGLTANFVYRNLGLGFTPRTRGIARFLRSHGVRAILSEYADYSTYWVSLAEQLCIPLFAHAHGHDLSSRFRDPQIRERLTVLKRAAGVVVVNEIQRARLESIGIDASKIVKIPCSVDIPALRNRPKKKETVTCLAVGRFVGKKAPLKLLEAFRIASRKNSRLKLRYVGDGPLFAPANQYVRDHGLEARAELLGALPHDKVLSLMHETDIFVQFSITDPVTGDEEGLPVAILEAMAHGLPVVSTFHAGIPEAVMDGISGRLVHESDISGMAEGILELSRDSEMRRSMGLTGRKSASERFSRRQEREALVRLLGL